MDVNLISKNLEDVYYRIMDIPNKILEIFNDFYGEERVDLQQTMPLDQFIASALEHSVLPDILNSGENITIPSSHTLNEVLYKPLRDLPDELLHQIFNKPLLNILKTSLRALMPRLVILVHFPQVRITNEFDKFVDINHLYAKIQFNVKGSLYGGFTLNRSDYSLLHIRNSYMHSHVSDIPFTDFRNFQSPCLGQGPIRDTIASLQRICDFDLWQLFCLELDKYVHVESIAGTPYHRLESLKESNKPISESRIIVRGGQITNVFKPYFKKFCLYFLAQKKLRYNYVHGSFGLAMSYTDYMVTLSNEFINWYNQESAKGNMSSYDLSWFLTNNILFKGIISDNKIYTDESPQVVADYVRYVGREVCTVKGKKVTVTISDFEANTDNNKVILLNEDIAARLLTLILQIINYKYGKEERRTPREDSISAETVYL